jgi:hypothetical protein
MVVRSSEIDPVAPSKCKCGCSSAAGCRFLATDGQCAGPALHLLPRGTEARACPSSPTGPTQNGTIEKRCCASHGQSTLPVIFRSFGRLEQKTVATEDRFSISTPPLHLHARLFIEIVMLSILTPLPAAYVDRSLVEILYVTQQIEA